MAISVDVDTLAARCFRHVPRDVAARDVPAALWHLLLEYAKKELTKELNGWSAAARSKRRTTRRWRASH
jgi:hypothetical protein